MKRYIPWMLAVVFLAAAIYFFALLIDVGISVDDAQARTAQLQERGEISLELIKRGWIGEPKATLLSMTEDLERRGVTVKNYPQEVEVGEIVFSISGDKIVDVRYMD